MDYKKGQKVVVSRNLGLRNDNGEKEYYHGGSISQIPLGSKATIQQIIGDNDVLVKLPKGKLWHIHPDELKSSKDVEKIADNNLSDLLKEPKLNIDENLKQEIPSQNSTFNPKFNAREEFAVWMKQEFPNLKIYSETKIPYFALLRRRKEVLAAAEKAYTHADETARSCVHDSFEIVYRNLRDSGFFGFTVRAYNFLHLIQRVSINVNDDNNVHYGTKIKPGRSARKYQDYDRE